MSVSKNIVLIQERIKAAAHRAGRKPEEITLMAVSKTFPAPQILETYQSGLRLFGESKVQEFSGKAGALHELQDAEWHMIGHLQTNKARKATEIFNAVDSVDSLRLAEKLDQAAATLGKTLPVLIEINVGGEETKSGVPLDSPGLEELLRGVARLEHLHVRGLMAVPPFAENPGATRPYFRLLRDLRDQIAQRRLPGVAMDVLSMGMSHDFEVAIEEGSTCVRVGTAIFGERPKP